MNLKSIFVATLMCLPLIPLIVLEPGTLSKDLTPKDILLAAPIFLEFMGFYAVYLLSQTQGRFSHHERKLVLLLAVGIFFIMATPVIISEIVKPVAGVSLIGFLLLMAYALYSLVRSVRKLPSEQRLIAKVFSHTYFYPVLFALILMTGFALFDVIELNAVALYFIFKNFLSMRL
jgi:hypothetical protein